MAQWQKSNAKFIHPVVIKEDTLARKLENVWDKAKYVARPNVPKQADRVKVEAMLDKLLEVTKCSHKILLCSETGSGCLGEKDCKLKAHINCDCPLESKVPVMELRWLAAQRAKTSQKSGMMMLGVDKVETARQEKAAKRKAAEEEAELKRKKKREAEEKLLLEQQEASNAFLNELDEEIDRVDVEEEIETHQLSAAEEKEQRREVRRLVRREERLKSKAMERQQEEMRRGVDEKEKHDKKENKKDKKEDYKHDKKEDKEDKKEDYKEEEEDEEKKNKKGSTTSMTLLDQIFGPDLKLDFMDQSQSLLAKAKMDEYLHEKSKQWKGMTEDQMMDDFLPPP